MKYTILEEEFTFADITAVYLFGNVTGQNTGPQPPAFTSELGLPDKIPCLNSPEEKNWIFELPKAEDPDGDEIFFDFQMNSLKVVQLEEGDPASLYLDLSQGTKVKDGTYTGKLQLIDSTG